MGKNAKIVYVNHGVANRFSDGTVELNRALLRYPKLKNQIIAHELTHTEREGFNVKDLMHDISITEQISQWEVLKFILKNPSAFSQLLPLTYTQQRGFIMDLNLMFVYGLIGLIILVGFLVF